jgi:hypothetical protein
MNIQFVAVWAGIPLVIAAVVIALLAMRMAPRPGALTRVESWIVSFIGAGAMMTALLGLLGVVGGAVRAFTEDPLWIDRMPYSGGPIERLMDAPAIVDSGYESAWLVVTGVPAGARALLALQMVLPSLAAVAIGVTVAWLAIMVIRERPFVRALPHAIGVAAIAVMIAGIGAQVAGAFGRAMVVEYLGPSEVTAGGDMTGSYDGLALMALNLDLAPIGWAFGLALVAAAFQIGTRLQRETDLLV